MTAALASSAASFEALLLEHEPVRARALEILCITLRLFPDDGDASREAFSKLFAEAQLLLELDDSELATLFKVSRPTIGRWTRGDSAPHPIGRKSIFTALGKIAKSKLRLHSSAETKAA